MRPIRDIEGIKQLPALEYPEVGSFRCVEVVIPDDDKYLWVLAGFIAILGNSWSWSGERGDRISRAALWKMAYRLTEWAACMNCEEMQECLQPLFDALRLQINQDAVFREFGTENAVGVPLPEEVITAPLAPGSNPTCNLDILWAQCEQLVDYSNTMITDVLEQLETATNNIELAQVITSLPILDELGADAIAGYIELLVDGIAENYAAEFDLAYRNGLACEIFCLCQVDCEITIERVYDILFARVVAHFGSPGEALSQIGNLLSYLLDQDIEGDVIVDSLMFLLWGSSKLINSFLQDVGTTALETVLSLAVNDANDDWILLCDNCPLIAANVGLFSECGNGAMDVIEFSDGVPFDVEAYEITIGDVTSYEIALMLPAGNWEVTLNSVTGTMTPPVDESETAYAWIDPTTGFNNVLWNAPAEPSDFGTKDTTRGIFSAWCPTQNWNAYLHNRTAFTANFTVTAI